MNLNRDYRRKQKKGRGKKIIEEILAENLPELNRQMHPHIESAYQMLCRINRKVHIKTGGY